MRIDDLRQQIATGESATLKFKRSTGQRSRAVETLCGMLNSGGGSVVFGVTPEGELVGQEIGAGTLEKLMAAIRDIMPPVLPDVDMIPLAGARQAIVLTVPGGGGPFCCRSRPFVRLGPTTLEMPPDMYELKIAEKLHSTTRWENQPAAAGVTIEHLDQEEILRTIRTAHNLGRLGEVPTDSPAAILTGLDLLVDGRPSNAAVALYGQDQQALFPCYPQLAVRLGRFRGRDRLADFTDNRDYWGGIFPLLRRAEAFLRDHVHIAGRVVSGKMQREDYPNYPPRATREALANAFCHRDYAMAGGAVEVAMYDDHLEITNPGEFHFGITPERLRLPHASRPWNPIIASVLHRAGVIERWGSGALNIVEWCREGGTPEPTWVADGRTITTTFLPFPVKSVPETPIAGQDGGQDGGQVNLSGPDLRLLGQLADGEMGAKELLAAVGYRARTRSFRASLARLREARLVELSRPGSPRSKHQKYRLSEQGKALVGKMRPATTAVEMLENR